MENYLATCCLFPSLWYQRSAEPGMAVPPSPRSHLLQQPHQLQIHEVQRKATESRLCIQPDIPVHLTKALLCSEQQETQACLQEASLSFNNQGLQVAISMLLLCAPGCCHFCLYSEIRKATSTCREITVLLISDSSTSLYTCFLGSKCLCF